MKIGIFSESFEPVLNGVTVSIATLTEGLRSLGHEVYTFAPRYPGYEDSDACVFRFPSFRWKTSPDYPLALPFSGRMWKSISKPGLDIVHTQTPFMLGWAGLRAARRLGIPIVSTNHTQYPEYVHYFPYAPHAVSRAFVVRMMRAYYGRCDAVVSPSRSAASLLSEYGVKTPVHVIPTGNSLKTSVNPNARSEIREEHCIPEDGRVLVYVGRLAKEKNLELLFESFERLAADYDDIYLLVVGGGPFEAGCGEIARGMKYGERVVLTGFIPRENVADYFAAGDIFVFPSTTETQGLVVGEALQSGLPCVVVREGGSREMLTEGEDGLLSDNDPDDFSSKIGSLLADGELAARMSEKAREHAFRLTPEGMAESMLRVYESVMAGSGDS